MTSDSQSQPTTLKEPARDVGVDELASALTSSILSTSLTPAETKPEESVDNSQASSFVGSLTSAIIQSSLKASSGEKYAKPSPSAPQVEQSVSSEVSSVSADTMAKSVIADALSLSSRSSPPPASALKVSSHQTSGQSSDSASGPSKEDTVVSLADQLTDSIISDVLSQPSAPTVALVSSPSSATSPPLNRPAIFIQVERRGSGGVGESPRSSRSSSLTGQSLTLHEYTDDLVESSCREGVAIAMFQAQGEEGMVEEVAAERKAEDKAAPSSLDSFFDNVVSTSIQNGLRQTSIEISPYEEEAQSESLTSTSRVIKQSPVLAHRGLSLATGGRRHPMGLRGDGGGDTSGPSDDAPPFQNRLLLLSTPSSSSHMSYAWSTASTRDEDSRPVSPTNLDRIALDLTQNLDEFSNLLSKIVTSEAIATVTGILGPPKKSKGMASLADESEEEDEREFDVNNLPTTTKIDVFLSRLDQASPISEVDEGEGDGVSFEVANEEEVVDGSEVAGAPYPSVWHKMRATLLRPVATGNWGCGAFKGDPQLKSMLQWAATSAAGRPQMIYCSFNNVAVKQVCHIKYCIIVLQLGG